MGILDNMKIMDKINGRTEVKNDPLTMAQQSIASAEAEIGKNLADLGRLIFELEEKGSEELLKIKEQNTEYNNLVDRVNKAKANKEAFYKNYLQLQGLMECINCKSQIHFGSIYCSNCGCKTMEVDDNFVPDFAFCTNCGQKLEKGSDFCTNCGTKINGGE
jgi:hypothetical protein